MKKFIDAALTDLRCGRGAEFFVKTRMGSRRIVFVPSPLFRHGNESFDLLIAFEGGGVIFYDNKRPLNKFYLVREGFSIEAAEIVVTIIERLYARAKQRQLTRPDIKAKRLKSLWTKHHDADSQGCREPLLRHSNHRHEHEMAHPTSSTVPEL